MKTAISLFFFVVSLLSAKSRRLPAATLQLPHHPTTTLPDAIFKSLHTCGSNGVCKRNQTRKCTMMHRFLLTAAALSQLFLLANCKFRGLKKDPNGPYEFLPFHAFEDNSRVAQVGNLSSWDWRNANGMDFTGPNRDQHQPNEYCGMFFIVH